MSETAFPYHIIFQRGLEIWAGQIAQMNKDALDQWNARKSAWLEAAQWSLATGNTIPAKPAPPAEAWTMDVDYAAQAMIVKRGPGLVADPTCELPLPEPTPEKPPGVVDIGANYGSIWTAGPKDTTPAGAIVEHKGKTLRKVHSKSPFGETRLYIEVV